MKLLILDRGGGFAGIPGRGTCFIDTELKKIARSKHMHFLKFNGIHELKEMPSLADYPSDEIKEFNYDISLLESFLPECELTEPVAMMDGFVFQVYVSNDKVSVRKIWDESDDTYPVNGALAAKMKSLILLITWGEE